MKGCGTMNQKLRRAERRKRASLYVELMKIKKRVVSCRLFKA